MAARAVPITYAPRALAICTPKWPTPPAAAWISTRCPSATCAVSTSICQAVSPASGIPAASGWPIPAGLRAKCREGAVTYSAKPPPNRGKLGIPYTSSPGRSVVTPKPTASTVPETSQPRVKGGSPSSQARPWPALVLVSTGFTPAACTRTSTSVGPGSGRSVRVIRRTSGPPKVSWVRAFICVLMQPNLPGGRAAGKDGTSG